MAKHARTRCTTPMSRAIRRKSTPSSVVRGDASNRVFKTVNGMVGSELAAGDVRIWPEKKKRKKKLSFNP